MVSNFVVQALRGQPLTLYGEGEQTRSFCYVDDLVNALIKLMNSEDFHEPVNLGNPVEFTIRQLASEVMDVCKSKSELVHIPLPEDDPRQRKPDISRAQKLLGWNPTIQLRPGWKRLLPTFVHAFLGSQ